MKIHIITPNGETLTLELKDDDTIKNIKAKIQDKKGISPNYQQLIFSGNELENNCKLLDYNIKNGFKIDLKIQG